MNYRKYSFPVTKHSVFRRLLEIESIRLEAKSRKKLEECAFRTSRLTGISFGAALRKMTPRNIQEISYLDNLYDIYQNYSDSDLKNPQTFMDVVLNYRLTDYQKNLVDLFFGGNKRITNRWSRQSGKTKTSCAIILTFLSLNPGKRFMVTGAGKRISDVVMNKMSEFLFSINPLFSRTLIMKSLKTIWVFRNGSSIIATPNALHALRGDTLHGVLIEEMEFIRDASTVLSSVVEPMLATTSGHIIANSTPWDTKSEFAKLWCTEECQRLKGGVVQHRQNAKCSAWSQLYVPYTLANKAGIIKDDFVHESIKPMEQSDYNRFQREFMANWSDDVNTYFTSNLISSVIDNDIEYLDFESYFRGEYIIGLDLGQKIDYSALVMIKKTDRFIDQKPVWRTVHRKLWPLETTFSEVIGYVNRLYHNIEYCLGVYVDSTNNPYVSEEMKKIIGVTEGVKITYTGDAFPKIVGKESLMGWLKQQMRLGYLELVYDEELINHLNVEKYELGKDGHFKFSHPDGTHDDLLFALALGVYATKDKSDYAGAITAKRKYKV